MRSMQRNDFFDKSRVVKSVMTSLEAVKEWLFKEPYTQPRLVIYIVPCFLWRVDPAQKEDPPLVCVEKNPPQQDWVQVSLW